MGAPIWNRGERGPGLPGPGHNPAPEPETGARAATPGPREKVNIGTWPQLERPEICQIFGVIIFLALSAAQGVTMFAHLVAPSLSIALALNLHLSGSSIS